LLKSILFSLVLVQFFALNIFALEISIAGAKQNHQKYSILHIKDKNKFLCQKIKDDFGVTTKVICAFSTKPAQKINKIQNDFFHIDTHTKKKTFFVIVKPFAKIKLEPIVFNLTKDSSTFTSNVKLSKHWMITGYIEKLPFESKHVYHANAINFPVFLDKDMLPYVGGLDIQGKPVKVETVKDVKDFIKIKRLYSEKKYERCLDLVEESLNEYPDTLFKPELFYYKIKLLKNKEDYDGIVELSKIYLREYSSNDNVSEILALTAYAYSKLGQSADADYFFERLFDEHMETVFAKWGLIYKGEMTEASGDSVKALTYYQKALKQTSDIDVAATAAFRIATYKINYGDKASAASYIAKIIKAKPDFFKSEYVKSKEVMNQFVEEEDYFTASRMAEALLIDIDPEEDDAEILLQNAGIWLSKTGEKLEALALLNRYLTEFDEGTYEPEVLIAKDSLFFDVDKDDNVSSKLVHFDELIASYPEDIIGDRAIYEKAKLLLQNAKYKKVLEFKKDLLALDEKKYTDTANIIYDSAVGLMKESLKQQECNQVLATSNEYNITLSDEWDDGVYKCSMKGADYLLARSTAKKNLNSKNLEHRKKWLYRYIKIDFATGNYSDVIDASNELITLIQDDKKSEYLEVYRYMFDTYQRLESDKNMIKSIIRLQKIFGLDYKDIERYVSVMNIGSKIKDDSIVIKYAKDIMGMQKKSDSYAQSPFVEFSIYESYMTKEDYNEALAIVKSLELIKLSTKDKVRQLYLLGSVYAKLWRDKEAVIAFDEVIKLDPSSSWATLAKDAKAIISQ